MGSRDQSPTSVSTNQPPRSSSTPLGGPANSLSGPIRPSSQSEWQLYAVLHRANLLQYYDTFIRQGGDDVTQLLEAGEEEFLEIMALVGMASKPLHVRRMQKSLQEFFTNRLRFELFIQQQKTAAGVIPFSASSPEFTAATGGIFASSASSGCSPTHMTSLNPGVGPASCPTISGLPIYIQQRPTTIVGLSENPGPSVEIPIPPTNGGSIWGTPQLPSVGFTANVRGGGEIGAILRSRGSPVEYDPGEGARTPTLTDPQIAKLAQCALDIAKTLPDYEPKWVQNKKKISRELVTVMEMGPDDPLRLEEFRRYAAIYGRFDAKRKADKLLTLHEVSVNEAAAQICLHRPPLLTRRDELFPLARQVVRNAGYNYAKGSGKSRAHDTDEGSSTQRKRGTPAESVTSSGDRSHTPGSSGPESPPTKRDRSDPFRLSAFEEKQGADLAGSPSSSGGVSTGGGNSGAVSSAFYRYFVEYVNLDLPGKQATFSKLTQELERVSADRETCKRRVNDAQEMGELTQIHVDLEQLDQRQVELCDRQAALLNLIKESGQKPAWTSASAACEDAGDQWGVKQEPDTEEVDETAPQPPAEQPLQSTVDQHRVVRERSKSSQPE